jgi:hypothetical protein
MTHGAARSSMGLPRLMQQRRGDVSNSNVHDGPSRLDLVVLTIATVVCFCITGCKRHYAKEDIVGSYQLRFKGEVFSLVLHSDGSYIYRFRDPTGKWQTETGSWDLEAFGDSDTCVFLGQFDPGFPIQPSENSGNDHSGAQSSPSEFGMYVTTTIDSRYRDAVSVDGAITNLSSR